MSNLSVGTRVRLTGDNIGTKGQLGTIEENDHSGVPYYVRLDGDGDRYWLCAHDVEAVPTPSEFFYRNHELAHTRLIECIKEYRSTFGVGLKEAKDAVEAYREQTVAPKPALAPFKKTWVITVLGRSDELQFATRPRTYTSAEQARTVARSMAERNRGERFVVFEATDVMTAPAPVVQPPVEAFKL
jgi:hypothetical protein